MSVHYSAYAVIGVRIRCDRLVTKTRERACEHEAKDGFTFCPHCGKPMFVERQRAHPALKTDEDQPRWATSFAGLTAVCDQDAEYLYVGTYVVASEEYPVILTREETSHWRAVLEGALTPYGFWDAREFGVWCLLKGG